MAFKSSDSQNLEGRNRGGKDEKKKIKKMRSIKLSKLSGLNSSSRRATWQFDLSAIDLAIEELDSMESSDAKKENFEGESESEYTPVSSSSSPLNLESNIKGVERKQALKKSRSTKLARFGSFRPSKRNPKSRFGQPSTSPQQQTPGQVSDASPDYSKPKSRSEKPSVRILKSKASFRSRRPLMKKWSEEPNDLNLERATCSSTLKDSKFKKEIELHEGENEIERISVMKVCPYHHCSLNGHCHGPEPVPKKPFLRRKKHLMKIQKSKENGDEKEGFKTSKRRENEDRDVSEILVGGKSQSEEIFQENDFVVGAEPKAMSSSGVSQENEDGDVGELPFGGKSQPKKIFQEIFPAAELNESILEIVDRDLKDEEKVAEFSKNEPSDTTIAKEANGPVSSSTKCHPLNEICVSREETDFEPKELKPHEDSKAYSTSQEVEPRLKKENSISMWHLIHRQMVSGLKEDVEGNRVSDTFSAAKRSLSRNISDADMGNEETESHKNFAIKLVREAIEKILLPEVQDQSSDDQSVTSDVISEENFGKNDDEAGEGRISNSTDSAKEEKTQENGDEEEKTARKEDGKSEKRAPKSWSYLKKIILLKRFVKELQKVREFNPRKPRYLPLELDQEEEKVSLRPQTTSQKRNAEEWMLDYAIRQVVSELAPKQKKKVALLVKAFETVAPPNEDQPSKIKVHKLKDSSQESIAKDQESHLDIESNEVDNVVSTSNCDSLEKITEAHKLKSRDFKLEDANEENYSFSNCHPSEEINVKVEEKKGDPKEEYESVNGSTPVNDSEEFRNGHQAFKSLVKRGNHISMWHLIHEQMVSGLAAESGTESLCGADEEKQVDDASKSSTNNDNVSQETEMRKIFAIKLVRDAIEKILLPEVQDQSSDDHQSTTSDVPSDQDLNKKNHNKDFEELNFREREGNNMGDDRSFEPKEESHDNNNEEEKIETKEDNKSEKQKPKSWSYLKKVILLKRFVKELEKVKKFNPKKPNYLPLEPNQDTEKVSLRPQMVGEKRNTDEWMLDYAIRQVVSQLAPTQKRKVALLVKAFETVAPPNEEYLNIRDGGSKSSDKIVGLDDLPDMESNISENIISRSNSEPPEQVNEEQEGKNRGFEPENTVIVADKMQVEKQNNIKMWHMIYQHVVSGIAEKVGTKLLLDGGEEDEQVENAKNLRNYEADEEDLNETSQQTVKFSRSDAVKLVQEAVDDILDDSSETQSTCGDSITTEEDNQSTTGDNITTQEDEKERVKVRNEKQKSKNWSKLKKLILLKRSIKALKNVRKQDPQLPKLLPSKSDVAAEKVDLRSQMVDERKKAEQWMLDYAVQHIVTKLTPARKRRVAMLVEAFEAVVPLPES
ncbi:hypothetical protein LguiB_033432 [Lonicera macranthoides]